jgi:hypothetical protein
MDWLRGWAGREVIVEGNQIDKVNNFCGLL